MKYLTIALRNFRRQKGYAILNVAGLALGIDIGPGVFAWTAALVTLLALVTISYQSIKAARTDPVKSLRTD